jgi:asparagine synthase (glutamine-hydrolysing)
MCGIYGELDLRDGSRSGQYAKKATDLLRHRGPDDGAVWRGGQIIRAIRRLSIIDLPGARSLACTELIMG